MLDDLDPINVRILNELQSDSSRSAVDLAESVGISQSQCWRRIQQLREDGYIKKQVALLDRKKLGLHAHVFALVKLSAHGRSNLNEFAAAIRRHRQVLECYVLMGSVDFLVRIVAEDVEAYEQFFFETLSQLPGVQEVNSIMALSEIKSTTELPMPGLPAPKRETRRPRTRRSPPAP